MAIRSFRDLIAWQRAMQLTEQIYALTANFPRTEQYGLTAQLRRAAVSIASNIAEGHARQTGHYLNHLSVACGSSAELQTQLELACRLGLVDPTRAAPVMDSAAEVGRLLHALAAAVGQRRLQVSNP
ncbi:MAG: four helix bundle protein [Vicinamibacterales bacterium]